jgi:hypothetical protein
MFSNGKIIFCKYMIQFYSRSCESQLIITIDALAKSLAKEEQVDVILLDFSKAFDKVPHHRLLPSFRICLDNRQSSAKSRTSDVVCSGKSFMKVKNSNGPITVPCGTLDITSAQERNDEDAAALQKDLTSLQQWEETWQMQFHPQKCNVIHVTNKRKPITHSYKLHDHILEVMENIKYLGVTINNYNLCAGGCNTV